MISSPVVVSNSRKKAAKTGEETGGQDQRSETVEERERDRDGLIQVRSSLAALTAQTQTLPHHIELSHNKKLSAILRSNYREAQRYKVDIFTR